jgi:uncharacterized damage-inducible protein DinB
MVEAPFGALFLYDWSDQAGWSDENCWPDQQGSSDQRKILLYLNLKTKMIQELITLFDRDLKKLAEEIRQYKSEEQLWMVKGEIRNSGGNLCYHLLGNLNHFIGAIMGQTGYIRNREEEFSKKNIHSSELVSEVLKLNEVIANTLKKYKEPDLDEIFPVEMFGGPIRTGHFLMHLYGHLNYHLGQINYHRRLTGE